MLGILYESFIHPITILTTLPSATVGAALALIIANQISPGIDLSLIAVVGILLLIGIVKKNAIMMIDFALNAERLEGKSPRDAIFEACHAPFPPDHDDHPRRHVRRGAAGLRLPARERELRRPLGITIIGGLIMSQMLTLYTTPVIYLYWDRLENCRGRLVAWPPRNAAVPVPAAPATRPLPEDPFTA